MTRSAPHPVVLDAAAGRGTVAYFSMEIALESAIPTYAGGLGVLAGDTVRGAADLGLPMDAVTLVHRRGYFRQRLDVRGNQAEEPAAWSPEERLEPLDPVVEIELGGRMVAIRGWRWRVTGTGGEVQVILLDTDLEQNDPDDRRLTDHLYGGDERYRLSQEAILGIGGVAFLRALGRHDVATWHMNEGHSALLTLALLEELQEDPSADVDEEVLDAIRRQCVFTTHTPVPAGHDRFPMELLRSVLGTTRARRLAATGVIREERLNMTDMALNGARFVNGVAMRHREVSSGMFPGTRIDAITNGVHAATWTSPPFQALFDREIPEWRRQSLNLRYAVGIRLEEIQQAHREAKAILLDEVEARTGVRLDPSAFTIGFARRATAYKRPSLFFRDLARLRRIAKVRGPLQVVYGGKAHPRDDAGKEGIRSVYRAASELGDHVKVVYLENYEMDVALRLCAGSDLWLNTPRRTQEASGTSGMKAAMNGVPSLSVLDGWWIEGHVEGVTGWAVGEGGAANADDRDAAALYDVLEHEILRVFLERPDDYAAVQRSTIALNGSFFSAERMVFQYARNAYGL